MLTCTRPERGSASPIAWTPGNPPLDSRTAAAISCATRDVVRLEVEVVRDERLSCADENGSRSRIDASRPEVGRELAGSEPTFELLQAAAPEERRAAVLPDVAVQEDGKPELLTDPCGDARAQRRPLPRASSGLERDERHDVGGADTRVNALVPAEIDQPSRRPRSRRASASTRSSASPASVYTERW